MIRSTEGTRGSGGRRSAIALLPLFLAITALVVCGACTAAQMIGSKDEFLPGCTTDLRIVYEPQAGEPQQVFVNRLELEFGDQSREGTKGDTVRVRRWLKASDPFTTTLGRWPVCLKDKVKIVFGAEGAWSLDFLPNEKDSTNPLVKVEFVKLEGSRRGEWTFRISSVPGYSETPPPPPSAAPSVAGGRGRSVSVRKNCNFREEPSTTSPVLLTIPSGAPVLLKERKGAWYLGEYAGKGGWLSEVCFAR